MQPNLLITRAASEYVLSWRGGSGRVSIFVLDVSGRVVRRTRDAGPAASGQWRWTGQDDSGRRLPAGVYFLRARDAQGREVARRVVLVR